MPRRFAVSLAIIALAAIGLRGDDDLAKELPRIPPTEPGEALKTFRIHEGFRLEPVAVEPIVTDPVSACYDADGRLYVVEMRGYPYPEKVPSGNVSRLEDTDGDGRFDKRTIFVDGLSWPTSVVPHDGGVFIAVAPEILYAKDADGDGVAEIKKVAFSGFGTQNVQALLNGLLWGPDGWIYGVSGGNGGDIKNHSKPDAKSVSVRGRDFRFRPDGSAFEAISGGGQFGHSFDDWGHRFTCNNSNHIRQVVLPGDAVDRNPSYAPPAVLTDVAVEGGAAPVFRISPPEPWRVVRTRQRAADPEMSKRLPPTELVVTGFFTSATGVTIYRGTAFPPEYRGNAFIGDVGGNLVHRKVVEPSGPIYQARRADAGVEFLASTDNWFRPVNFANTPDGALLILDMYRETIEHPASIPEPIKKHLDLTSGHDRGRLYQLVPDGFRRRERPKLGHAETPELVARLADPDAWWRETAQRLLIERRDEASVEPLRALLHDSDLPQARMLAAWTLSVLDRLRDEDLSVSLRDPDLRVRASLAPLAGDRADRAPEFREALGRLARSGDAMASFEAALALGRVRDPSAVPILAAIAVEYPGDPWIRAAVLTTAGGRAWPILSAALDRGLTHRPEGRRWLDELAALVGAEDRPGEVRAMLERFARPGTDPGLTRAVVSGLGRGLERAGGSLRDLLGGPVAGIVAPLFAEAAAVAAGDASPDARAEAARLLGLGPIDGALDLLPNLLDAREPAPVQMAALHGLAALPDRRVGPTIVGRWKSLGPALRREGIEALLARRDRVEALLDAMEREAIAPSELDPARRGQLLAHPDPALRERAGRLLGPSARPDREAILAANRKALDLPGDVGRGRAVFRQQCATCHRAEGAGNEVGPDLATTVGRSSEDLLTHILDPNREVAPAFVNYLVATDDGRVLTGLIAEESGNAVTLRRAEGARDVVPRARIESMTSTGLSLMPEGLEKEIAPPAMADLLAFLRSIRTDSAPPGRDRSRSKIRGIGP